MPLQQPKVDLSGEAGCYLNLQGWSLARVYVEELTQLSSPILSWRFWRRSGRPTACIPEQGNLQPGRAGTSLGEILGHRLRPIRWKNFGGACDRANVRTAMGAFSLSTTVPAGTVIAALTGAVAAPIVGTLAALGFGLYNLVIANMDKKEELMKSCAAYLVRLENRLHPSRLKLHAY